MLVSSTFVHVGQLNVVHVRWPAQRCSCWSAQRCSCWPAQRCSCRSAQRCSCQPAQRCMFILASSTFVHVGPAQRCLCWQHVLLHLFEFSIVLKCERRSACLQRNRANFSKVSNSSGTVQTSLREQTFVHMKCLLKCLDRYID